MSNTITPESQRLFEDARAGKLRNVWYAPSLFITNYGPWGFKFEVDATHYDSHGKRDRNDGLNIDGPTVAQAGSKSAAYQATKAKFWAAWKEAHPGEYLLIGKCMTSWGL